MGLFTYNVNHVSFAVDLWNAIICVTLFIMCYMQEVGKITLGLDVQEVPNALIVSSHRKETVNTCANARYEDAKKALICKSLKIGNVDFAVNDQSRGLLFATGIDKAEFNGSVVVSGGILHYSGTMIIGEHVTKNNSHLVLAPRTVQPKLQISCPRDKDFDSILFCESSNSNNIISDSLDKYALVPRRRIREPKPILVSEGKNQMNVLSGASFIQTPSSCVLMKMEREIRPVSWSNENICYLTGKNYAPTWGPLPSMLTTLPDTGLLKDMYAVVSHDGKSVTGHEIRNMVDLNQTGASVDDPNVAVEYGHFVKIGNNNWLTSVPIRDNMHSTDDPTWLLGWNNTLSLCMLPGKQVTIEFDFPANVPISQNNYCRLVTFDLNGKCAYTNAIPKPVKSSVEHLLLSDNQFHPLSSFLYAGKANGATMKNVAEPAGDSDAVPLQCLLLKNQDVKSIFFTNKKLQDVRDPEEETDLVTFRAMTQYPKGLLKNNKSQFDAQLKKITNVPTPILENDASNNLYVDCPKLCVEYRWNNNRWSRFCLDPELYETHGIAGTGSHFFTYFPCTLFRIDCNVPANQVEISTTNSQNVKEESLYDMVASRPTLCNQYIKAGTEISVKTIPQTNTPKGSILLFFSVVIFFP